MDISFFLRMKKILGPSIVWWKLINDIFCSDRFDILICLLEMRTLRRRCFNFKFGPNSNWDSKYINVVGTKQLNRGVGIVAWSHRQYYVWSTWLSRLVICIIMAGVIQKFLYHCPTVKMPIPCCPCSNDNQLADKQSCPSIYYFLTRKCIDSLIHCMDQLWDYWKLQQIDRSIKIFQQGGLFQGIIFNSVYH